MLYVCMQVRMRVLSTHAWAWVCAGFWCQRLPQNKLLLAGHDLLSISRRRTTSSPDMMPEHCSLCEANAEPPWPELS